MTRAIALLFKTYRRDANRWVFERRPKKVCFCSSNANSGTHAEFVCIDVDEVTHKPRNINHLEAASLPYAACKVALCSNIRLYYRPSYWLRPGVHCSWGSSGYCFEDEKKLPAESGVTGVCWNCPSGQVAEGQRQSLSRPHRFGSLHSLQNWRWALRCVWL